MGTEIQRTHREGNFRKEKEMKKKYLIVNSGEEGVFAEFEFTQEEFEFLKKVFDEINTHSKY